MEPTSLPPAPLKSPPPSIAWQNARVVEIRPETARAKTLRLALDTPVLHHAGQHCVVRLTAPDGYTATRSYSIASAPDESDEIELTVERLDGGEVSSFLHDEVAVGDDLEVRGPIGRWFVWDAETPALLLGGGSGVVPLMAMLRHARRRRVSHLVRFVVSVRTPADLYYADEIVGPETTIVYTRATPPGFSRLPVRLAALDIPPRLAPDTRAYVCGSSGFADAASAILLSTGIAVERIRVERFGPSG